VVVTELLELPVPRVGLVFPELMGNPVQPAPMVQPAFRVPLELKALRVLRAPTAGQVPTELRVEAALRARQVLKERPALRGPKVDLGTANLLAEESARVAISWEPRPPADVQMTNGSGEFLAVRASTDASSALRRPAKLRPATVVLGNSIFESRREVGGRSNWRKPAVHTLGIVGSSGRVLGWERLWAHGLPLERNHRIRWGATVSMKS
jgi:hypothetical protein